MSATISTAAPESGNPPIKGHEGSGRTTSAAVDHLSAAQPADPPGGADGPAAVASPAAPIDDGTTALYLTDANGTVYLAEIAGVVGGPLWRLHEAKS